MYKGIYIALSGAALKQTQMDLITQNLANSNTSGYKRDKISFQEYLLSQMNGRTENPDGRSMSYFGVVNTDYSPGSIVHTGGPLDVAIDGEGYLSLDDGSYTRRGDLHLDSDGYLVTQGGIKVLGSGGPIQIAESGSVQISGSGAVSVNNATVDTLKIVEFSDPSVLRKTGDSGFVSGQAGTVSAAVSVRQGYLEKSNVDAVKEMVQMITALREFETYQKAIHCFDESTGRVITEIAKI
ncbi:MAG: flagellar basal-body rod protein FlgF [Nitrospirales bacterium]|nr:flagellar basal-body rod protein FlgF [Nitrospirales bacterium]